MALLSAIFVSLASGSRFLLSEVSSISELGACTRRGAGTCFEERSGWAKVGFHGSDFWSDFRIFGFLRFWFIFHFVASSNSSGHPRGVFERRNVISGCAVWMDFVEFLSNLWAGILDHFRVFGVLSSGFTFRLAYFWYNF